MPGLGEGFPGAERAVASASQSCLSMAWERRREVPRLWHGGPHWCRLSCPALSCVSPRGGAGGRQAKEAASLPEPRQLPAVRCRQRPRYATAPWLVLPGPALLCAGSWRLWVCISNFKGMSYFLEKTDRLNKKQIT